MRLIDADALLKWLDDYINEHNHGDWYGSAFNADWIDSVIDSAPTIDAVPVVRCGECVHCHTNLYSKNLVCGSMTNPNIVSADNFCKYGKRRADNG